MESLKADLLAPSDRVANLLFRSPEFRLSLDLGWQPSCERTGPLLGDLKSPPGESCRAPIASSIFFL